MTETSNTIEREFTLARFKSEFSDEKISRMSKEELRQQLFIAFNLFLKERDFTDYLRKKNNSLLNDYLCASVFVAILCLFNIFLLIIKN